MTERSVFVHVFENYNVKESPEHEEHGYSS